MARHHAEVVGDENDRHVAFGALLSDELEDLCLHGDIERGRRLIGEEESRSAGERDRDHDSLAHSTGKFVRILINTPIRLGNSNVAQQPNCRRLGVSTAHAEVDAKWLCDLLADPHHRVERDHWILEHHRHFPTPQAGHVGSVGTQQVLVTKPDAALSAGCGGKEAHDRAREHGLARA